MELQINGQNENYVVGHPKVSKKSLIKFKGINNKIFFGENVTMEDVRIEFAGNEGIVEIGNYCKIKGSIIVTTGSTVKIGSGTKFNKNCRVHASERSSIDIGTKCLFANVRFRTSDSHSIIDLSSGKRINYASSIVIGNRVWIAEDVCIYKGVCVGDGSIIGSHAVVVRDIPSSSLAVGVPARVVRNNVSWDERLL